MIDLREPAAPANLREELTRRARRVQERERAVGCAFVHGSPAMIDVVDAHLVVGVAAVRDHLGAPGDELSGIVLLIAPDLAPVAGRDVVGKCDEIEARAALIERVERIVEHLAHGRRTQVRVLGMHVQVSRIPTGATHGRLAVVSFWPVGLCREVASLEGRFRRARRRRRGVACRTLGDAATPSSAAHRRELDRPREERARRLAGRPMRGFATYSASLENPSSEMVTSGWLEPPHPRNCSVPKTSPDARLPEPEVERWRSCRSRACPSNTSRAPRGAARHDERHHHVALAQVGAELARDHLVRGDRAAAARGGERRRLRRRGEDEQIERDQCGGGARADPIARRSGDAPGTRTARSASALPCSPCGDPSAPPGRRARSRGREATRAPTSDRSSEATQTRARRRA